MFWFQLMDPSGKKSHRKHLQSDRWCLENSSDDGVMQEKQMCSCQFLPFGDRSCFLLVRRTTSVAWLRWTAVPKPVRSQPKLCCSLWTPNLLFPSDFNVKVPSTSDKSLKHVDVFSYKHCLQHVFLLLFVLFIVLGNLSSYSCTNLFIHKFSCIY